MDHIAKPTHPLKKQSINWFTRCLRVSAPLIATNVSQKIWLKPKERRDYWPKFVKQFDCDTRHGVVKGYRYGHGKEIWLIHGWSGSGFQFWPLMQKLADKGFSTVTFDFPAHGFSEGKFANLPKMIQAFDDIGLCSKRIGLSPPGLVITHSMGASVVANSVWLNKFEGDLMLIAPVLDTYKLLQEKTVQIGFDQILFNRIIKDIKTKDRMNIPDLNATSSLCNFSGNIKVIHDITDSFAPIEDSKNLVKLAGAELYLTDNLGHGRILKSSKIVNLV